MAQVLENYTEDFGFNLATSKDGVPLFPSIDLQSVSNKYLLLLSVSETNGLFAASDSSSIVIDRLSKLNEAEATFSYFDKLSKITQLRFVGPEELVVLADGLLYSVTFSASDPTDISEKGIVGAPSNVALFDWKDGAPVALTSDGELRHGDQTVDHEVSWFSLSHKTKDIYYAKKLSLSIWRDGSSLEAPDVAEHAQVLYLSQLGDETWLIIYNESDDPDDTEYRSFLATIKGDTVTYEECFIADPMGELTRPPSAYTSTLFHWLSGSVSFIASNLSTDLNTFHITNEKKELLVPELDSKQPVLPLNDETDEDVAPIGLAIDLSNKEVSVNEPCLGVDSATGLPKVLMLGDSGNLIGWWVYEASKLKDGSLTINKATTSIAETSKADTPKADLSKADTSKAVTSEADTSKADTSSKAETNTKADPSASAQANPFGSTTSSAFSSAPLNTSESTKESNPLGSFKPAQPTAGGFGATSFGSMSAANKASPWGQSSFGSTSATSSFGKSSFGQSSFGQSASGFGSTTSAPSPFAKLGGSSESPFGGLAKSTSPFGGAASESTTSPFSQLASDKPKLIFGSTTQEKGLISGSTTTEPPKLSGSSEKPEEKPKLIFGSANSTSSETPKLIFEGGQGIEEKPKLIFGGTTSTGESPFASLKKPDTAFGASPFASSGKTESPFASIGKKPETTADPEKKDSPFAASDKTNSPFAADKKSDSPFAAVNKGSDSPFASADKKTVPFASGDKRDSPFSGLGKTSDSPFGGASFGGLSLGSSTKTEDKPAASPFGAFGKKPELTPSDTQKSDIPASKPLIGAPSDKAASSSSDSESSKDDKSPDTEAPASAPAQAPGSSLLFGSNSAENPFGQSTSAAFGNPKPSSNLFGQLTTSSFGKSTTEEKSASPFKSLLGETLPTLPSQPSEADDQDSLDEQELTSEDEAGNPLEQPPVLPVEADKPTPVAEPAVDVTQRLPLHPPQYLVYQPSPGAAATSPSDAAVRSIQLVEAQLEILKQNTELLTKYVDEHLDTDAPEYPDSLAPELWRLGRIDSFTKQVKPQVAVTSSIPTKLAKLLDQVSQLPDDLEDLHHSVDSLNRLVSLLKTYVLSQAPSSKDTPLDAYQEHLQKQLRKKHAHVSELLETAELKLLALRASSASVDLTTVNNLKKLTFQLNARSLKAIERVRSLEEQMASLTLKSPKLIEQSPQTNVKSTSKGISFESVKPQPIQFALFA